MIHPRQVTAKGTYQISQDSFLNIEATTRGMTNYLPATNLTFGTKIYRGYTAFTKVQTGTSYSFVGMFLPSFLLRTSGTASTLTVGVASSAFSVDVTTNQFLQTQVSTNYGDIQVPSLFLGSSGKQHGWRLSANASASLNGDGASVGITTEKRLTENTSVALGMGVGIGSGALTMRIRISRLGQRLSIPILLSHSASIQQVLLAVIIPGASIITLQHFYLTPRRRRRIAAKLRELREEMKEVNEEKRREAEEARELLREQVERRREVEEKKDRGLVILEAVYSAATGSTGLSEQDIKASQFDVTIAVQALVSSTTTAVSSSSAQKDGRAPDHSSSTLIIPGGRSKSSIIGFYDVLVGARKQLSIKYLFAGRYHEAVFGDFQAVALPMRSHLME